MDRARWIVFLAYALALGVALTVGSQVELAHPIGVALAADVAATVVIFAFSLAFRNSSFYDPYWSVAPLPIALYWALRPEAVGVNPFRLVMVIGLITLWGARLTWNWNRGWHGLGHASRRSESEHRRSDPDRTISKSGGTARSRWKFTQGVR